MSTTPLDRLLSNSPYGLNDNGANSVDDLIAGDKTAGSSSSGGAFGRGRNKRPSWQEMESAEINQAMMQAHGRGVLSTSEVDTLLKMKNPSKRNWVQKAIFDAPTHVAGMLGADVYDDNGDLIDSGRPASGSFLDTLGDLLSLGTTPFAAIAKGAIEDPLVEYDFEASIPEQVPYIGGTPIGPMRFGTTPSAFFRAWNSRASFTDLSIENEMVRDVVPWDGGILTDAAGGLVLDIAMDPLTYVTLGVSAGAKGPATPAIKSAAKGGARGTKLAAYTGEELTTTRLGREMYQLAAERVMKSDNVTEAIRASDAAEGGLRSRHILDGDMAPRVHEMVIETMVRDFDELSLEMLRRQREGKWRKMGHLIAPGGQGNQSLARHGAALMAAKVGADSKFAKYADELVFGIDDMFQETARGIHKEVGLYDMQKMQLGLSGRAGGYKAVGAVTKRIPYVNKAASTIFDTFDKGWSSPPEVVEMSRNLGFSIRNQVEFHTNRYTEAFGHLGKAERETVSEAVEARWLFEHSGDAALGVATKYSDEIEEAITFFQKEMDDIRAYEVANDFNTQTVKGYVTHFYKDQPEVLQLALDTIYKNGEISTGSAHRHLQERMIASIAHGEEIFGEGALLKDSFQILRRRRQAAIDLIEKTKFNDRIIKEHGTFEYLMAAARTGAPKGLIRGLMRRAGHGVQEVVPYEQVYRSENGRLTELGFREGDLDHATDLVAYLQRENVEGIGKNGIPGKFSPDGLEHAKRVEANQVAELFSIDGSVSREILSGSNVKMDIVKTKPLPQEFTVRVNKKANEVGKLRGKKTIDGDGPVENLQGVRKGEPRESFKFGVNDSLKMLRDPNHIAWETILHGRQFGGGGSASHVVAWIRAFNKFTVKNLDSQLPALVPNLEEKIIAAVTANARKLGHRVDPDKVELLRSRLTKEVAELAGEPVKIDRIVGQLPSQLIHIADRTMRQVGNVTREVAPSAWTSREIKIASAELGLDSKAMTQLVKRMFNVEVKDLSESQARVYLDMLDGLRKPDGGMVDSLSQARHVEDKMVPVKFTLNTRRSGAPFGDEFADNLAIPTTGVPSKFEKAAGVEFGDDVTKLSKFDAPNSPPLETVPANLKKEKAAVDAATTVFERAKVRLQNAKARVPKGSEESLRLSHQRRTLANYLRKGDEVSTANATRVIIELVKEGAIPAGQVVKHAKNAVNTLSIDVPQRVWHNGTEVEILEYIMKAKNGEKVARKIANEALRKVNMRWKKKIGYIDPKDGHYRRTTHTTRLKHHNAAVREVTKQQVLVSRAAKQVRKSKDAFDNAEKFVKSPISGGIEVGHKAVVNNRTKSEILLEAKQNLAKILDMDIKDAGRRHELIFDAREAVRLASDDMAAWVVKGSPIDEAISAGQHKVFDGVRRPKYGAVSATVHLPESVAKLIKDIESPLIPPELKKTMPAMYRALNIFDQIQNYYKTNLLLPWTGTWGRNAISNASIAYMKHGLSFLSPEGNFRNARNFHNVFFYILATKTDLPRMSGLTSVRIAKSVEEMGEKVIETKYGRTMKVKDLADHMRASGVTRGNITHDGTDILASNRTSTRPLAALSGAAAGMAAGGLAGGLTSLAATGDAETGNDWGSLMGAAAGAVLGGRKLGLGKAALGGIPVPGLNKVTGLLQSQWAPFMRVGEAATETPFRTMMFLQEFVETGSLRQSSNTVFRHLNDVSSMSVFERRFMRRMVPFYTWSKLATRQFFFSTLEEPQRLNNIMRTFDAWNNGHAADPEDRPDFLSDRLTLIANDESPIFGMILPKGSGDHHLAGFGLPVEDVAHMSRIVPSPEVIATMMPFTDRFAANGSNMTNEINQAARGFLTRGPFGVVAGLERLFNKDSFTGREIDAEAPTGGFNNGEDWETAPAWLKHIVQYKQETSASKATVNANIAWLLGETPISRFVDVARRLYEMDEEERVRVNPYTLARTLLGANAYKIDPKTNKYWKNRGRIDKMAAFLGSVGVIKKRTQFVDATPIRAPKSGSGGAFGR